MRRITIFLSKTFIQPSVFLPCSFFWGISSDLHFNLTYRESQNNEGGLMIVRWKIYAMGLYIAKHRVFTQTKGEDLVMIMYILFYC